MRTALLSTRLFSHWQSDRLRKAPDFFGFDLQTATLKPASRVAKAKKGMCSALGIPMPLAPPLPSIQAKEQGEAGAGNGEDKTAVPEEVEVAPWMCECGFSCWEQKRCASTLCCGHA